MNLDGTRERTYHPNKWVILRHPEGDHTVLGGWGGGYLHGQSWRRSSSIQSAEEHTAEGYGGKSLKYWKVCNHSGSVYILAEGGYGTTSMTSSILVRMEGKGVRALSEPEMYEYMDSLTSQSSEIQLESEQ